MLRRSTTNLTQRGSLAAPGLLRPPRDDEHTDGKVSAETIALIEKSKIVRSSSAPSSTGACPTLSAQYFDIYR